MTTATRSRPRWTNHFNVDPAICNAVTHGEFYGTPASDFTVTELLDPPQKTYLGRIHRHELQEDVSSRLWALQSQAAHEVLRRGARQLDGVLAEERLTINIGGYTISGKPDLWSEAIADGAEWDDELERWVPTFTGPKRPGIADYKETSVVPFLKRDRPTWEQQTNAYGLIYRVNGFPVERIVISALLRDHSKQKVREAAADKTGDYPPSPFIRVDVPIWTDVEVEHFLEKRLRLHLRASAGEAVQCSPEDRWRRPDTYALYEPKNLDGKGEPVNGKRAAAVFGSGTPRGGDSVSADRFALEKGLRVITRNGEDNIRCRDYCPIAEFCPQYGEAVKNGAA